MRTPYDDNDKDNDNDHEADDRIGSDQLVQRFIDNELSSAERAQLLMRMGQDGALRERLIELEQLAASADRLPRAVVPADFVARVMERTAPRPSAARRLGAMLWAPHAFQWNLAGALGATCVVLLITGAAVSFDRSGPTNPTVPTIPTGTVTESAAATAAPAPQVLVRLVMLQPGARTVGVAGDFNEWNPLQTPLEPTPGGAWTVTLPLEPGRYEYMFVIDGTEWIADPFAVEQQDDGFGLRNAVLDVRSPLGASL